MDFGSLFKFLHVTAVIIWLGAGFATVVLGIKAERAHDNNEYGQIIGYVNFLTPRLFIPAALCALLFGALTVYFEGWEMLSGSNLWVWLGLLGFAATFSTGIFVLKPRTEALAKLVAGE